jgi:hypothetical protein
MRSYPNLPSQGEKRAITCLLCGGLLRVPEIDKPAARMTCHNYHLSQAVTPGYSNTGVSITREGDFPAPRMCCKRSAVSGEK